MTSLRISLFFAKVPKCPIPADFNSSSLYNLSKLFFKLFAKASLKKSLETPILLRFVYLTKFMTMKKIFFQIALLFIISSCVSNKNLSEETSKSKINSIVDKWHKDAAETNFQAYFDAIADDGIFIGTDATENWNKKDFMTFSKPFFDKGKAWDFTSLERNIYFSTDGKTAWFDELLNTQMKICRGSGVLVRINNDWKIKHYVLSMTIPNDNSTEVISIKSTIEDKIIKEKKK